MLAHKMAEIKNVLNYASTLPRVFTAQNVRHIGNYVFLKKCNLLSMLTLNLITCSQSLHFNTQD